MFNENDTPETPSPTIDPTAACQEELQAWKDRCLRMSADFENYKRRTEKEKGQWLRTQQGVIFLDLLAIVDDFDRALDQAKQQTNEQLSVWLAGVEMTRKALQKMLQKYDVQEIQEHEVFNPHVHEAVMQVEAPDHIAGSIVQVLQKGYTFKGEVLRPAKVSVAQS